jgi:hypothetical protein
MLLGLGRIVAGLRMSSTRVHKGMIVVVVKDHIHFSFKVLVLKCRVPLFISQHAQVQLSTTWKTAMEMGEGAKWVGFENSITMRQVDGQHYPSEVTISTSLT